MTFEPTKSIVEKPRLMRSAEAILAVLQSSVEPVSILNLSILSGINYSTCSIQARILEAHGLARRVDQHRPVRYVSACPEAANVGA